MKKIMILFGKDSWGKSKPFSNKKYMYSYEYFYALCKKKGIQIFRASYEWYDYEKKLFKYAWIFEKNSGIWKRVYDIKPDLVYDKTKSTPEANLKSSLIRANYAFFNDIEFSKIIDNKLAVGMLFSSWSKKNRLIKNLKHLSIALDKIPKKQKLVLKPANLSGGENVFIGTGAALMKKIKASKIKITDWMLQDFIDSSGGIPGIMKGAHDLRLVIIDTDIIYAYYRKPAAGSLLANLAQGGSMEIVPLKKLPKNIYPIVKKASQLFSGFEHKIYTIDLMFDKRKTPWIVELNSMPGMYFAPGQEKTRECFYNKVASVFKNILD
jgi:glutathione synthase/RimK-type ligase-like ATP-grasp enzyme